MDYPGRQKRPDEIHQGAQLRLGIVDSNHGIRIQSPLSYH